jgi:transposase InsO family protein
MAFCFLGDFAPAKVGNSSLQLWGVSVCRKQIQSMSRKGDCWDNAPSESFFNTLKTELCGHKAFAGRNESQAAIFEYIEVYYNRMRLHSTLGYRTPTEYEEKNCQRAS